MKQSTRVELACKSSPGFFCDCPHVLTTLHHQLFFSRFIKYVFPPIDRPLFRRDAASRLQFANTGSKTISGVLGNGLNYRERDSAPFAGQSIAAMFIE
jgi:hypothetical protein